LLHQVGDLFELNVKLRCQKVNCINFMSHHICWISWILAISAWLWIPYNVHSVSDTLCVNCGPLLTGCRLHADVLNSSASEEHQLHYRSICRHLLCLWHHKLHVRCFEMSLFVPFQFPVLPSTVTVLTVTKSSAPPTRMYRQQHTLRNSRCFVFPSSSVSQVTGRLVVEGYEVRRN